MEFLRNKISWLLLGGAIIAGCGPPSPIILNKADSDCGWIQGGGNSNRTAYVPDGASGEASLLWTKSFDERLSVEPTAAFGAVLIPASDQRIYVISIKDGSSIAEKKYKRSIVAPIVISDSLAAIIDEEDHMIVENWFLQRPEWEVEMNGSIIEPLAIEDKIYWIDGHNYLRCYLFNNGTRVWDRKLKGHYFSPLTGSDRWVFAVNASGVISCFDLNDGSLMWEYDSGDRIRNSPIFMDKALIYCTSKGSVAKLEASTGRVIWINHVNASVFAPLASDGKGIFMGTSDRYIYRLDFATGKLEWANKIGGPVKAGPTVAGKLVVFVGIDGKIYFVDVENGEILADYMTDGMLTTRPLACNGKLYVAGEDKNLYCFNLSGD